MKFSSRILSWDILPSAINFLYAPSPPRHISREIPVITRQAYLFSFFSPIIHRLCLIHLSAESVCLTLSGCLSPHFAIPAVFSLYVFDHSKRLLCETAGSLPSFLYRGSRDE